MHVSRISQRVLARSINDNFHSKAVAKPLTSIGAIAHKESIDDHSEQSKPKTIDDH